MNLHFLEILVGITRERSKTFRKGNKCSWDSSNLKKLAKGAIKVAKGNTIVIESKIHACTSMWLKLIFLFLLFFW